MAGQQLTPFDTQDLGAQLLRSLVAADEMKTRKEQLKLQEKELELQQQVTQQGLLQHMTPEDRAKQLSQMTGQPMQPNISPEEAKRRQLDEALANNPELKGIHERMLLTNSPLEPADQLKAAKAAAGLIASPKERGAAFLEIIKSHGSEAGPGVRAGFEESFGAAAPTGMSVAEKQAEAQIKAYEQAGNAQQAALERARLQDRRAGIEAVMQGFLPRPGSPDEKDPAKQREYASEWAEFLMGEKDHVSPEAMLNTVPTAMWAKVMGAQGAVSDQTIKSIDFLKTLADGINKIGDIPEGWEEMMVGLSIQIYDDLYPPPPAAEGGETAPPSPGKWNSFTNWFSGLFGGDEEAEVEPGVPPVGEGVAPAPAPKTPAEPFDASKMTIKGRKLRPKIASALTKIVNGIGTAKGYYDKYGPGKGTLKQLSGAVNTLGASLEQTVDKLLNTILVPQEPGQTLGPLSDPSLPIGEDLRGKLKSLMSAYRETGASAQDTHEMERDLVEAMRQADLAAQADPESTESFDLVNELLAAIAQQIYQHQEASGRANAIRFNPAEAQ